MVSLPTDSLYLSTTFVDAPNSGVGSAVLSIDTSFSSQSSVHIAAMGAITSTGLKF